MKAFTVVAALGFALLTVPVFAQQKPPAQKPPATPTQPAPATPTQKPVTPAPQPPAQPPRPFPEGAKIAYCSLQQVASLSKEGKTSFEKVQALQQKKVKELDEKRKAMEANQAMLNSPSLAEDKRSSLSKEIERQNVEIQRLTQDAQSEVNELQNELQDAFLRRVMPIVQQVANEKGLQMVLNYQDGLLLWADNGLDLSAEVARRLDAAPATPAKQPGTPQQ